MDWCSEYKRLAVRANAETVLDTSCGWGDRLAGFFASKATHYYGCDPNPNTYKIYQKQIEEYSKFFKNKTIIINSNTKVYLNETKILLMSSANSLGFSNGNI